MRIEYTREGMKITHPTGVVQILSIADLARLKKQIEWRQKEKNMAIIAINTHITKIQEESEPICNGKA